MFYVITGTNREAVQNKREEILDELGEVEVATFDSDTWSPNVREEYTEGQGLFSERFAVFAYHAFSVKELRDDTLENLEDFADSENVFVFIENEIDKTTTKKLKKHAADIYVFGESQKERDKRIFALTDAIGKRDRKLGWQAYQRVRTDQEPEQIFPMIFWQVKNIGVAQVTKSAKEAGMSPFPYKKAKEFSRNFTPNEIKQTAARLTKIYHDAHRGEYDMSAELERWILEL